MKKGFTLVELLVVISIIGVLIALSVFGLQGARESSRDTKRKSDLEAMRSALELYKADCGLYPLTADIPGVGTQLSGDGTNCDDDVVYMESWPQDSLTDRSYYYFSNGTTYMICAALENGGNGGTGCGSNCGTPACNHRVNNP